MTERNSSSEVSQAGSAPIAEIDILWLTAGLGCDGDTIAVTAATQPSIEICQLMRAVERERKLEGKPPLVQFLPRSKRPKKTPKKTEGVHPSRRPNGPPPSAAGVKNRTQEDAHE